MDTAEIIWTAPLEELLCNEAEKCSGLAWLHTKAEAYFSQRNNWLQIPVIILSTLTGFFSAGSESIFGPSGGGAFATGSVSILVGILGTINSYFSYAKRSEGHRLGSTQYSQIHRTLMIEMSLPREQRTPPKLLLKVVKDELKRLAETLPRIPENIIEKYKKEIVPHSEGIQHPEITNGIHRVEPYSVLSKTFPTPEAEKPKVNIKIVPV